MVRYAAFLRGISPLNPNMKNVRLRARKLRAGFENVQTVISSGNVLFESADTDSAKLESCIEKALPEQLGFHSMTIILSEADLKRIDQKNTYKRENEPKNVSLSVSFTKKQAYLPDDLPHKADAQGFGVLGAYDRAVYWRVDEDSPKAQELMRWLEKAFKKELTTRNWKTVERILKKWDAEK